MKYQRLGKTGYNISEISLGTWQLGGVWGSEFDNLNADSILHTAIDNGVNFIDTADVYSNGQSESAIGRVLRSRKEEVIVATKCGRKINPHVSEGYQPEILQQFVEDSLRRLRLETLDLIQLHCPPNEVYYRPEIFELFDRLKTQGKIRHLGVSVEKVEEGLKAIEYPNVSTVQIIFNMFRLRPAGLFFQEASRKDIGIIVRVPLASGLLTGKFDLASTFGEKDHRHFNRNGEVFDKGETFSGIPYDKGIQAVQKLRTVFDREKKEDLAGIALKWILQFDEVSCVIPGASKVSQVTANVRASDLPDIDPDKMRAVKNIYDDYIREKVHHLW